MGQVLTKHNPGRAVTRVEDEFHSPIPATKRAEGGHIRGELETLRREEVPNLEGSERVVTTAGAFLHEGELVRVAAPQEPT